MQERPSHSREELKYLGLLSEQFPTCQTVFTEIINLEAILNLPKATEHFMSDVHGEYEAFTHILNNCSGVIRERVAASFRHELTASEQAELCTLIYYPTEKLHMMHAAGRDTDEWYSSTLLSLIRLARYLSDSYTRSKVRKAMPVTYAYIIEELLHASAGNGTDRHAYHVSIIRSIVETGSAGDFICSLSSLIKRLAVDHLHIVGDLFDRGPHADRIIDHLMGYHSLDIQWGNHDILWMGAAAGSEACIAAVVRNNVRYDTLEILESAYGISLRELALFAESTYRTEDVMSNVEKAISTILFKLEGQVIKRHPEYDMDDRLLLERMDLERGVVTLGGRPRKLVTIDYPTFDEHDPYALTPGERKVMDGLVASFHSSDRLHEQVDFLYEHGSTYLVYNGNLLFHGCVPLEDDGSLRAVACEGGRYAGHALFDACDRIARRAWHEHDQSALDWMWYLSCGKRSPLSGRDVKTFERTYLSDETTWHEQQDAYYALTPDPKVCERVLAEFGLRGPHSHIINGHTPVRVGRGESPIKAGGKLLVIDGGFCAAYHEKTGIAGYTLISDAQGMRIKAHRPFKSIEAALDDNADIVSDTDQFEIYDKPKTIADSDTGTRIRNQIADLTALLEAYRTGELAERKDR